MKKIVPFKKDIIFDGDILEITSISLEHTLDEQKERFLKGNFHIFGSFKKSEENENFSYDLPFEINLDSKYDTKEVTIEVEDFYYEVLNNKVLSVSIDLALDNLLEIEEKEEIEEEKRCVDEEVKIESDIYKSYKVYIVRENDTVESIIEKYGVKKEILEEYNDLSILNIGDKIIIPYRDETNS